MSRRTFTTRYLMEKYLGIRANKEQFKCPVCNFTTSYAKSLRRHRQSVKSPPEQCNSCDNKFCTHQSLIIHQKKFHLVESSSVNAMALSEPRNHPSPFPRPDNFDISWKVRKCSKLLPNMKADLITVEMATTVAQSLIDDSILLKDYYRCQHCDFCSKDASHFQEHILSRRPETQVQCHLCNFKSCTAHGVTNHVQEIHSLPLFTFETVQKPEPTQSRAVENTSQEDFAPVSPYNVNAWSTSDVSTPKRKSGYLCTTCTERFDGEAQLNYHSRVHIADSPFACDRCSYSAVKPSTLKKHISTRKGDILNCLQCELTFCFKTSLKKHVRLSHAENIFIEPVPPVLVQQYSEDDGPVDDPMMPDLKVEDEIAEDPLVVDLFVEELSEEHCDLKFSNQQLLLQHNNDWHGVSFDSNSNALEESQLSASAEAPFKCYRCSYSTLCSSDLQEHQESGRKQDENFFSCKRCFFKSCTFSTFQMHLREIHYEEEVPPSKHQQLVGSQPLQIPLVEIIDDSVNKEMDEFQQNQFCPLSNKEQKDGKRFKAYVRRHTPRRLFQCDRCSYASHQKEKVVRHKQTRARENRELYSCFKCIFKSCTRMYFVRHLKEVHPEEVINSLKLKAAIHSSTTEDASACRRRNEIIKEEELRCPFCKKKFRGSCGKWKLEEHFRIHTGEKPYKCNSCSRTFAQRSGLYHHNRRHHKSSLPVHRKNSKLILKRCDSGEERSNVVEDKRQSQASSHQQLRQRIKPRTHTGNSNSLWKQRECKVCGQTFSNYGSLFRHKSIHYIERVH